VPYQARHHAHVVRRGSRVRRYVEAAECFVGDGISQCLDVHQQEGVQFSRVRDEESSENRCGQYECQHRVSDFRFVVQKTDDDRGCQEQVRVTCDVPRLYHALRGGRGKN